MLRVGIDTTPLIGPRTGVGQFTAGLVGALTGHVDVVPFEMTWRGRRAGARPLPARAMRMLWSHIDHPAIEWWTGRVDAVHGTNYVVPPTRRAAEVVSVHDLTSVRFPELCTKDTLAFPGLVKRALRRGAMVHCDSQFVADEVIAWSGCSEERVRVVPLGIPTQTDLGRAASRLASERPFGGRPYVLVLGTIEPRKDHPTVLRAFDALCASEPDLLLVVAGSDGWGSDAYAAAVATCSPATGARIVREREVTDTRRNALVAGARMLVYPSVYEGFGFPPLEAMAAGVPVVSSDAGSLPEVLADGAEFVAVGDVDSLTAAMIRVHTNETVRESLVARGRRRSAEFSWERCAHEMTVLYADAVAAR